ncbi:MFS transporter [Candidatus Woesearchaeota archaeon]|nr:MFS transporter [Candidatus Woesearchaeota archaeon]
MDRKKEGKKDNEQDEEFLKEKTKKLSIKEGVAYSVMDGAGLRYISPYALSLGANNTQIGLLTSLSSLIGNFSQIFSPRLMEKKSRKNVILFGVLFQALMWIPLILIALIFILRKQVEPTSIYFVIAIYTMIVFFGSIAAPAWNSLMKDIITKESGKYFGFRNRILGITALVVMILASLLLNYFKEKQEVMIGFIILFSLAFLFRIVSFKILSKHYEPKLNLEKGYYFSFKDFIKESYKNNFGKFTLFIALIMFATSVASPFFTVYMLKNLNLNYFYWTLITISSSISTIIFMPIWGKISDKFGNLRVLKVTGALIPFVPFLWFFSVFINSSRPEILLYYLFPVEFFSGIVWAGFNLSSLTFIYDAVSKQRLALCVAYYNALSGVGIFLGALLGGLISSLNIHFFNIDIILWIFMLSAVLRMIVYLFMINKIKEVRKTEEYKNGDIIKHFKKELKDDLKMMIYPVYNRLGIHPIRQT